MWQGKTTFLIGLIVALAAPVQAEQARRAFFFGNSLINYLTDSDETTVPHWLNELAVAGGHEFAADGVWGFPQDFATELPPEPEWSFDDVQPVWDAGSRAFRRAGFDTIILNPANFIHYDPPDAETIGPNVVDLTIRVFDWTQNQTDGAQFFLYEGWSNMEDFSDYPPSSRELARYHAFNRGAYHDWNVAYLNSVRARLPDIDIRLIPVASVLAQVLSDTVLSEIPAEALYSDISPHGTPTKYLLAAMVTYAVLYNEPPPAPILPDSIDPILRDNYTLAAEAIWQGVTGAVLPDGATTTPMPIGPLTDPWLGMGLNGISDWSTQTPFIDLMKTARPWVGHTVDQWGAWDAARFQAEGYLDANGWLTMIPPELDRVEAIILNDQPMGARSLVGRYRVAWEGQGEVSVAGLARDVQRDPEGITFSYTPAPGMVAIAISASDPADPIRNITVMREDLIPAYEGGERFNPDWLRVIEDMRALRFMDWMATNGSTQVNWTDRPTPADYTYGWRGVPVEVMVDLANRVGADPWFTLPHMADDAYVAAFATYVRDNLDPKLKVYAEWSNEVWNFVFPQAQWAAEQATARWGAAGANAWMQYAGLRAAQAADIWAGMFGPESDRLVRVVATQTGWKGLEEQLLDAPLVRADGLPAPYTSFDAYAVTGYFGYDFGGEDSAETLVDWIENGDASAQVAATIRRGSLADLTDDLFPYHARIARDYGLDLVMYEGGTHLTAQGPVVDDEAITGFFTDFSYSADMAALYAALIAGWRDAGGTLFMGFVDVAAPSKWGSWGALRHLDDMNPRWATLVAANGHMPVTWETREPGTFLGNPPATGD